MTTATIDTDVMLPGMFRWHCSKPATGSNGHAGVTCIAQGTEREEYERHARSHGLRPITAPGLIRLGRKAPAAKLGKMTVADVLADITWTDRDGTAQRGQYWASGPRLRTAWVMPYGAARPVLLNIADNGQASPGHAGDDERDVTRRANSLMRHGSIYATEGDHDVRVGHGSVYGYSYTTRALTYHADPECPAAAGESRHEPRLTFVQVLHFVLGTDRADYRAKSDLCRTCILLEPAQTEEPAAEDASDTTDTTEDAPPAREEAAPMIDHDTEVTTQAAVSGYGTAPMPAGPEAEEAARAARAAARQRLVEAAQAHRRGAGVTVSETAAHSAADDTPEAYRPSQGVVATRTAVNVTRAQERAAEIIAQSLRYAERVLTRHVSWPTPQALDTVLLWLLHANSRDRDDTGTGPLIWRASPRLMLTSKERGSGKSTGLDLIAILSGSRAGRLSRVTAPGFAKLMAKYQETAVLDEAKMIFGSGQKSLDLQGMLLTGYTRRANSLTAHNGGQLESVFGSVAYAGKDNLITTASDSIQDLLDRSIIIRMRRPSRHYPDIDDVAEKAAELAQQGMATWATTMRGDLLAAVSRLNREAAEAGELDASDVANGILRAMQLWRPLIACADVLGGDWPERAREAAAAGDAETDEWLEGLRDLDAALWAEPGQDARAEILADLFEEE